VQVSREALTAMLACDERRARDTHADIETQRIALKECSFLDSAAAEDSARFLRALQAQPGLVQGLAVGPLLRFTHARVRHSCGLAGAAAA